MDSIHLSLSNTLLSFITWRMCLLEKKERYIHYNIVHFLHKAECNYCHLDNPLRLIYAAITYGKRYVLYVGMIVKQYIH